MLQRKCTIEFQPFLYRALSKGILDSNRAQFKQCPLKRISQFRQSLLEGELLVAAVLIELREVDALRLVLPQRCGALTSDTVLQAPAVMLVFALGAGWGHVRGLLLFSCFFWGSRCRFLAVVDLSGLS